MSLKHERSCLAGCGRSTGISERVSNTDRSGWGPLVWKSLYNNCMVLYIQRICANKLRRLVDYDCKHIDEYESMGGLQAPTDRLSFIRLR